MNNKKKCPRCGASYKGFGSISRRDNKTGICNDCGSAEALFDVSIMTLKDSLTAQDVEHLKKKESMWLRKKVIA